MYGRCFIKQMSWCNYGNVVKFELSIFIFIYLILQLIKAKIKQENSNEIESLKEL